MVNIRLLFILNFQSISYHFYIFYMYMNEEAYLYFHFYDVSIGQNTESHGKVFGLVAGWSSQLSIKAFPNTNVQSKNYIFCPLCWLNWCHSYKKNQKVVTHLNTSVFSQELVYPKCYALGEKYSPQIYPLFIIQG